MAGPTSTDQRGFPRPYGIGTDIGAFSFDYVPLGNVRLEAQDPLTARNGLAAGTLTVEGHLGDVPPTCLALDVSAEGLGTVHGLVTSNDAAQPGIEVELVSGRYRARTFSGASPSRFANVAW